MSDKTSMYISHKLQATRKKMGYTQAEASKRAGTTVNHYAKIERGEVMPSLKTLEKIVKALGAISSDVLPF
jgi:transcriptional regulator with XRE-family HTH domain